MTKYKVTIDGREYEVVVEAVDEAGQVDAPPARQTQPSPTPVKTKDVSGTKVEAPLSGSILSVKRKVGDKVSQGEVLLSLEALKLENEITAPVGGTVVEIVSEGATVETGETIAIIQ